MVDKTAVERLEHVAATPFKRLSYTDAVADPGGRRADQEEEVPVPGASIRIRV